MSLRLLYLFFRQVLGLVVLSCRSSSAKDVELLVLRWPARRPAADLGLWPPACSVILAGPGMVAVLA